MRKLLLGDIDALNKYYGFLDDTGQKCFLSIVGCGADPRYSIITDDFMVFLEDLYRSNLKERILDIVDEGFIVQIYEFDTSDELLNWLNDE